MPKKTNSNFKFGNTRPKKFGAKRGSRNAIKPIPFPKPIPNQDALRLNLASIIAPSKIKAITAAKKIVFHTVGDTGGVRDGAAEETVIAETMEADFTGNAGENPAFFYHLGDVVYYNFDATSFPQAFTTQFVKPYQFLQEPIVTIPGNHDSSPATSTNPGNLQEYMKFFCAKEAQPLIPDFDRTSMTQPYLFYTFEAPYVKIIGLYSNNGEGEGVLDPGGDESQLNFLKAEFIRAKQARPGDSRAVLVAVHHPLFSVSNDHGASPTMLKQMDALMQQTGFIPDAFLSGHVHGFESFVREYKGRDIPYIICGTGGYNDDAHVKQQFRMPLDCGNGFTLTQFFNHQFGYMRLTIDEQYLTAEYIGVARRQGNSQPQPNVLESFSLDLQKHTVSNS
jgi:hypothetical protein